MIEFSGRGILLDIEGTTSSVSFVYDVMFPFARRELESYLHDNWNGDALNGACQLIARDTGADSFEAWCADLSNDQGRQQRVRDEIVRLMDGDIKATGLKQLQGLIWKSGFDSGEIQSHLYDDVPPALEAWNRTGLDVRIYSSGSIAAQKLFFGHTIVGDLLHQFRGHYDTTSGGKKEAVSYEKITAEFNLPPAEILFLSDVPAELDAAAEAGMQTGLCCRPGNAEVPTDCGHPEITDFSQVTVTTS